jgi:hypothetical protein
MSVQLHEIRFLGLSVGYGTNFSAKNKNQEVTDFECKELDGTVGLLVRQRRVY